MFGYQGAGTSPNFVDEFITMYQTAAGGTPVASKTDLSVGVLKGKQRNAFGSSIVYNNNLDQIRFDKFTSSGFATTYTTQAETAVQMLGSHEYYFWGWGKKFLSKLSDGVSFKFFRVTSDFETIAAQAPAAQVDVLKIEQQQTNLFQVPFKTIIPPVFVQDVAVFFIATSSNIGYLYFYQWNTIANYFELKNTVQCSAGALTGDWQNEISLIRALDGVIFKENGKSTIKFYKTLDYSYTASTVTVNWNSIATGAVDLTKLVLRQTRDDWLNYIDTETVVPTIAGFMNDDFIFTFEWTTNTLTCAQSIAVPCSAAQVTAGCDADRAFVTMKPQWFDLGINYVVVMSPIDCAARF
jgi:hypothetical protein